MEEEIEAIQDAAQENKMEAHEVKGVLERLYEAFTNKDRNAHDEFEKAGALEYITNARAPPVPQFTSAATTIEED